MISFVHVGLTEFTALRRPIVAIIVIYLSDDLQKDFIGTPFANISFKTKRLIRESWNMQETLMVCPPM